MKELNNPALLERAIKASPLTEHLYRQGYPLRLLQFDKGEYLSRPLQPLRHLLWVCRGQLKIYGIHQNSQLYAVSLVQKGGLLGDMEFCGHVEDTYFTQAMGQTLCLALAIAPNRPRLEQDPVFLRCLLDTLSLKLADAALTTLVPQSLEERLLAYLAQQPGRRIQGMEPVTLRLHCSRRQLQRVLKKLCQQGITVKCAKGTYQLA